MCSERNELLKNEKQISNSKRWRVEYIILKFDELWLSNGWDLVVSFDPPCVSFCIFFIHMKDAERKSTTKLCHVFISENGREKFGDSLPKTWVSNLLISGNFMTTYTPNIFGKTWCRKREKKKFKLRSISYYILPKFGELWPTDYPRA